MHRPNRVELLEIYPSYTTSLSFWRFIQNFTTTTATALVRGGERSDLFTLRGEAPCEDTLFDHGNNREQQDRERLGEPSVI